MNVTLFFNIMVSYLNNYTMSYFEIKNLANTKLNCMNNTNKNHTYAVINNWIEENGYIKTRKQVDKQRHYYYVKLN